MSVIPPSISAFHFNWIRIWDRNRGTCNKSNKQRHTPSRWYKVDSIYLEEGIRRRGYITPTKVSTKTTLRYFLSDYDVIEERQEVNKFIEKIQNDGGFRIVLTCLWLHLLRYPWSEGSREWIVNTLPLVIRITLNMDFIAHTWWGLLMNLNLLLLSGWEREITTWS